MADECNRWVFSSNNLKTTTTTSGKFKCKCMCNCSQIKLQYPI